MDWSAPDKAGGIDPVDGVSEKTWRDRIATRFAAELEAKPTYAMLRIFSFDDDGREIVRVDRMGPNDTVRIVPEEGLQKRSDRNYFTETLALGPGQIYVSPLDLGRRDGLIEERHRPTIRIATPVFADDGKPFGIFMINVDMRRAFDRVRSSVLPGETIYVVNRQGDYLIHPDRSREFGALLGKPNDWKADFPASGGAGRGNPGHRRYRPGSRGPLGRDSSRPCPAGRHRMGRRDRNHPQRRDHGAGRQHQKHLPSGRNDRGVVRGRAGPADREVADPADHSPDRRRTGGRPQREDRHSG